MARRKKTNEEFIKEVYDLVGDEYTFLEEYINSATKIKCKHNLCGYEWHVTPNSFLSQNSRCPKCSKRKSNDKFIKEVYELVGDEYTFLEEYIDTKTKIKCKHNKCGHIYFVSPNNFLNGNRCPQCMKLRRTIFNTKTNEEFLREVYNLVGNEYTFLENYINSQTKIKCRHNKCRYEWYIKPNHFLRGHGCPKCNLKPPGGSNKLTYEEIKNFIEIESSSGCKLLSKEYIDNQTKLTIQCKCGKIFKTTFSNFQNKNQNKRQCNQCGKQNFISKNTKTNKEFIQEVFKLVNNEYTFLEEYKGSMTKIKCKHNKCGYIWNISPASFLKGTRCPKCMRIRNTKSRTKSNAEFIQEVYNLVGNEYIFLEKYINNKTKIKCKHNTCGYKWYVFPGNILRGHGCPKCLESKGEKGIASYLDKYSINYIQEYKFDDCKNKIPLPFDFYLSDYNICIEYDGGQHYRPIDYFGGKKRFKYIQQNDNIKNQYCKDNNIPLLRIPYWEFDNIEKILDKWLSKYGLIHNENIKNVV